jgi:hypothetical protein
MLALPSLLGLAVASQHLRLHSFPIEWQFRPTSPALEAVRRQLLAVLDDCMGFECDRVRWRVHTAECAQELWLLRDAVFQAVAAQHCRDDAVARMKDLVPALHRLLPDRQLPGA